MRPPPYEWRITVDDVPVIVWGPRDLPPMGVKELRANVRRGLRLDSHAGTFLAWGHRWGWRREDAPPPLRLP